MSTMKLLRGALIGGGLMYLLDPRSGARRRAQLAGKLGHLVKVERELIERARRDASNRLRGMVDQLRTPVLPQVSDDVLEPRVRSKLGHCVSHPRSVLVDVVNGHVTLAGPIIANEADHLIREIATIRGVKEVLDALDRHATPEGVPSLQGDGKPLHRPRTSWSPLEQLAAVGVGTAMVAWGTVVRRGILGFLTASIGGALVYRATVNRPLGQLTGAVIRKHRRLPEQRRRKPTAHILH